MCAFLFINSIQFFTVADNEDMAIDNSEKMGRLSQQLHLGTYYTIVWNEMQHKCHVMSLVTVRQFKKSKLWWICNMLVFCWMFYLIFLVVIVPNLCFLF